VACAALSSTSSSEMYFSTFALSLNSACVVAHGGAFNFQPPHSLG
jgi:hypothetical protein